MERARRCASLLLSIAPRPAVNPPPPGMACPCVSPSGERASRTRRRPTTYYLPTHLLPYYVLPYYVRLDGVDGVAPHYLLLLPSTHCSHSYYLTTYHLPLTTYHLPLTTYHLPLTTYRLPLTAYRLPLTTTTTTTTTGDALPDGAARPPAQQEDRAGRGRRRRRRHPLADRTAPCDRLQHRL